MDPLLPVGIIFEAFRAAGDRAEIDDLARYQLETPAKRVPLRPCHCLGVKSRQVNWLSVLPNNTSSREPETERERKREGGS